MNDEERLTALRVENDNLHEGLRKATTENEALRIVARLLLDGHDTSARIAARQALNEASENLDEYAERLPV